LTQQLGMMASSLEHRVPELLFTNEEYPGEAVSAMKALVIAAEEGQRIYTVTHENVDSVLPVLNVRSDVKNDIRNAVGAGKVATVSQNQVTVGNWTGVGYIIIDPKIGTGAYMISGGSNGGAFATGVAQGVAFGAIILALLAAMTVSGVTAMVAASLIMLISYFIFPLFVLAVSYAETVFTTEEERNCMKIGVVVGMMFTDFIKAIHTSWGAVTSNAVSYAASAAGVGWFASVLNCL